MRTTARDAYAEQREQANKARTAIQQVTGQRGKAVHEADPEVRRAFAEGRYGDVLKFCSPDTQKAAPRGDAQPAAEAAPAPKAKSKATKK